MTLGAIVLILSFSISPSEKMEMHHTNDLIIMSSIDSTKIEMTFEDPFQDLGQVRKGEKKETSFKFVNTGTEAISIELVSACECTTLDWPRKAITPGGTGEIKVIFDSSEKEESETIEIEIYLKNIDPKTQAPIIKTVNYKYQLLQ